MRGSKIITVGICPAWDITCRGRDLDWGRHKIVGSVSSQPAGKALNISQALAWMGQSNTASGLWGGQDYEQMLKALRPSKKLIKVKMTIVEGATRCNISVVDTTRSREMHLRSKSELASKESLKKLRDDLQVIVNRSCICIFAGSMPNGFLGEVIAIMNCCRENGAGIVLDTSGSALKGVVDSCTIWLAKPNVAELGELLGEQVRDNAVNLARAGRKLLGRMEIVCFLKCGKR